MLFGTVCKYEFPDQFSNHPDEHSVIFRQNVFIRSITTFVPNLKTARSEKKKPCVYPIFVHFFPLRFSSFFLVNHRDTGTSKLLNELPKIANWYLSRSSIIGGRIRPRVCPSSILATWQVRQMGVLFDFLERFLCGEWMYVNTLKTDGKTCMLQLQLIGKRRMQTVTFEIKALFFLFSSI